MSRLVDQIKQALEAFSGCDTMPALIGDLALAAHQIVRATSDVDLLADANDADRLHAILLALGYRCAHRSEDAANYLRGDEGLNLLYAHRPTARRLLVEAPQRDTALGRLRVISAEGLIGLKLQAFVNNPKRLRDLDDIRALLRAQRGRLNMAEVQEYFVLFDRNCADNAACEGFFGLLKRERVHHRNYRTRDEARADLFDYLERFHNPRMRRRVARKDREFSALIKPSVETR